MNVGRGLFALVLSLSALVAAADALAQYGGMPAGRMRGGRGSDGENGAAREQQRAGLGEPGVNMVEQTIEELRVDLKLLPAQMPAWESYTSKVRAFEGDIARSRAQKPAGPEMNVLQRLDRSVDAARNRLAAMEEVSDAAKELFAMLAPEQKVAADPRLATIVSSFTDGAFSRCLGAPPESAQDRRRK